MMVVKPKSTSNTTNEIIGIAAKRRFFVFLRSTLLAATGSRVDSSGRSTPVGGRVRSCCRAGLRSFIRQKRKCDSRFSTKGGQTGRGFHLCYKS